MEQEQKTKEETGIVLDFLPNGYPFDTRPSHIKAPVIQAIGTKHFVLLELVPKKDISLQPQDTVYIGEGKRDKIHHIVGRLPYEKLTETARSVLKAVLAELIEKNEQRFVEFFNNARPLSTRMHSLELLPGLGKKRMWDILNERDNGPFKSFDDLKQRVKQIPDPKMLVFRRIIEELEGNQKHYFFVE